MSKILIAIPIKPSLNPVLLSKCLDLVGKMPAANPKHEFTTYLDFTPIKKEEGDNTPWAKVARARNLLLTKVDYKAYDYILWIDADVVDYPADMPSKLIAGNPEGISAPSVLVEDWQNVFYDWAAFIYKGKSHIEPTNRNRIEGRNINPYSHWNNGEIGDVIDMDCVGTITMVPTWIYATGVAYTNHPAFTDHYPLCKVCTDTGKRVTCDRSIIAYHANLPKYGEAFH